MQKKGGIRILEGLFLVLMLGLSFPLWLTTASTNITAHPQWASPEATAMERASEVWGAQEEPNLLNNLD